ncbi:MAG: pyridoxal-phosphate dependent enzyme [Acidobacteria bacterium]|nr:pyridoxal-phosphate dependent enzyme [Acidobacteriota bacterium]
MSSAEPKWFEVKRAQQFLQRYFRPSRLIQAKSLSDVSRAEVRLKLECDMPTGSFKVRGALYALHVQMTARSLTEVVAASTGNHGAAVAYSAKLLNVGAKIFLPVNANPTKKARIREFGAEIIESGRDISAAVEAAREYAGRTASFLLNDATNPDVPAATGVIAVEVIEEFPQVTEIWVPVGDTALIRGVSFAAKHLKSGVRIVGIQAERAPAYYLSWKQGSVVETETCDTIADGLATRLPVEENVATIRKLVDDIRLVGEREMMRAIEHLVVKEHIVVEPAGAAPTAAWLSERCRRGQIVLLVSGSNVAESILRQSLRAENDCMET